MARLSTRFLMRKFSMQTGLRRLGVNLGVATEDSNARAPTVMKRDTDEKIASLLNDALRSV